MNTRTTLTVALFLVSLCSPAPVLALNPIAIRISGPSTIGSGVDIEIPITLTNTSHSPIRIAAQLSAREAEQTFKIVVVGVHGEAVPKTAYGLALGHKADNTSNMMAVIGSYTSGMLAPNQTIEQASIISNVYEMKMPGRYMVQVERFLPSGIIVKSNTIVVTVIEPSGKLRRNAQP